MSKEQYFYYLFCILRFLLVASILIVSLFTFYFLLKVAYPFFIALIIALMINPLVNFFVRLKIPRTISVFISIIAIFTLTAGILTILVSEIISGSNYLARVVPNHFEDLVVYLEGFFFTQIMPIYNDLTSMFNDLQSNQQETIIENIQNIGAKIGTTVSTAIETLLKSIPLILGALPNIATVFIFSILATFFISKDWYKFKGMYSRIIPQKVVSSSSTVYGGLRKALVGFIRAQITLIAITAVIVLVGLLILKVNHAITVALIIGLVDLLPYLGTGLVFVPWIVYAFFNGQMSLGIGLAVLYAVVIVQRQIMEPKILSSSIGLDPLATLVSLFVGFQFFGFLGLIIGPVILVIIKTLHETKVLHELWSFIIGKKIA